MLLIDGIELVLIIFKSDNFPMRSVNNDDVDYAKYLATSTTSSIVLDIPPQYQLNKEVLENYHLGKCFEDYQ